MKIHFAIITSLLFAGMACTTNHKNTELSKPNIILILADDLGYGDMGCYGQQLIETPNIDQLASGGMQFTQHYSGSAVCAPSRCVLMTGLHTGHAHIRGNDEWKERGPVWDYHAMLADSTLEGQRPLPKGTQTIASLLKSAGYKTGAIGKWGLGAPNTDGIPNKQGFDFFCGYNCQRQAHTYYPVHLYRNENRIYLGNDTVAPHTLLDEGADPADASSYSDFTLNSYAPDVMFGEMIEFIETNQDEPFFMYWASPIPHVPLQAPAKWLAYYQKKFGEELPYLGEQRYFPQQHPHAAYAAMVSSLDEHVGQLMEKLKELGIYENTLVIFTSDNGPTYNGGTDSPWFNSGGIFNSEKGWGKGFLHEGGIRVPMIASWPGKIEAGSASDHISAFWDLLPTLCEVAGAEIPENTDGLSYLPVLMGKDSPPEHEFLYWEFPEYQGQQAIRINNWKAIRKGITEGNMEIELYNLDSDIREENNVADEYPQIVKRMEQIMIQEHEPATIDKFNMKGL